MADPEEPESERPAEGLFRALTNHSRDVISLLDAQGRLIFNSAAAQKISGFTPEELAGVDTFELIHPDDRAEVQRAFSGVLAEPGAVATVRYRYRTKAGGWTWMEAVAANHFDDPVVRGVVANSRDISERVLAEEERRASESRFRTFLSTCLEGFMRLGTTGVILECNDQFAQILGFGAAAEVQGMPLRDLFFPEDLEGIDEEQRRRLSGESARYQRRIRHRDGSERWVQISAVPDRDAAGQVVGVLAFLADVTQARRLEAQLARAQKLEGLGTLAGGVAHDFNNLLVGIQGGADLARAELPAGHPAGEPLRIVHDAARRAAALCRQLLTFAGRAEPKLEPLHLETVLGETADLLAVSAGRDLTLRRAIAPDLPAVVGDPLQLRQVLLNLVVNAAEASRAGDVITLSAAPVEVDRATLDGFQLGEGKAAGRWVRLEVADQGQGMPAEVLARIFDPFFTTKQSGRGLGLAATLGVVSRHGGCIRVQSRSGQGTTFTILLPPAPAPPAARPTGAEPRPSGRLQGRALVVDDEPTVRRVGRRILERLGLQVEEAADGLEAAAAVEAEPSRYALVLLDLTMPRLDGVGALARIRRVAPALPVILATGYAQDETRERLRGLGISALLEKPYDLSSLGAACRSLLGAAAG